MTVVIVVVVGFGKLVQAFVFVTRELTSDLVLRDAFTFLVVFNNASCSGKTVFELLTHIFDKNFGIFWHFLLLPLPTYIC